jgi:hypothetical protein
MTPENSQPWYYLITCHQYQCNSYAKLWGGYNITVINTEHRNFYADIIKKHAIIIIIMCLVKEYKNKMNM